MSNLVLVKSEMFGNVQCDVYQDSKSKSFYMTREQIGTALEYVDPMVAIAKIHERRRERVNKFSFTRLVNGRKTYFYSAKGIYEICRWSQQPKADQFYDFVYELLEGLRTGQVKLQSGKNTKTPEQIQLEIEIRARNARIREANLYRGLAREFKNQLSEASIQQLVGLSAAVAAGSPVLPLPQIKEKLYSAEDIAKEAGVSANMVGRVANKHNLKTEEYGMRVLDQSRHSSKQVEAFRYYENGKAKLLELLGKLTVV